MPAPRGLGSSVGRGGQRLVPVVLACLALGCTQRIALNEGVAGADGSSAGGTFGRLDGRPRSDRDLFAYDARTASGPDGRADALSCTDQIISLHFDLESASAIVALDRSFSMLGKMGDVTRLQVAQMAVRDAARTYQRVVHFGYEEFPGVKPACPCCAGPIAVPPGSGLSHFAALDKAMKCETPQSACFETVRDTPISDALKTVGDFYKGFDPGGPRFAVLITDGDPSCSSDRMDKDTTDPCVRAQAAASELHLAGITTFVIGLSEDVKTTTCLDPLSSVGGAPRAGVPSYYFAADETQLRQVVTEVTDIMATRACHLTLKAAPSAAERLSVKFDGVTVPRDANRKEGWNLDGSSTRMTFYGTWCDNLRQVNEVTVEAVCTVCGGFSGCR